MEETPSMLMCEELEVSQAEQEREETHVTSMQMAYKLMRHRYIQINLVEMLCVANRGSVVQSSLREEGRKEDRSQITLRLINYIK